MLNLFNDLNIVFFLGFCGPQLLADTLTLIFHEIAHVTHYLIYYNEHFGKLRYKNITIIDFYNFSVVLELYFQSLLRKSKKNHFGNNL